MTDSKGTPFTREDGVPIYDAPPILKDKTMAGQALKDKDGQQEPLPASATHSGLVERLEKADATQRIADGVLPTQLSIYGEAAQALRLFSKWQAWRDPDELLAEYEKYKAAERELSSTRQRLKVAEELAAFGAAVLKESRADLGDIDGGWLQDKAVELGVLVTVEATESCGEHCQCAEYGDFPATCYRYSKAARAFLKEGK